VRTPVPELRYDGRVAVVTGGGRGLGAAYCRLLAARGAAVIVNDNGGSLDGAGADPGPAAEIADELLACGADALANTDSVATADGARAVVDAALRRYGRIDILVHNAGNVRRSPLVQMTDADFDAVVNVHLRGGFQLSRAAFGPMRSAGYGRIVLTSSIGGLYGNHEVANYAAAKAGILGLANVVALEGAAHGIRCNVIVPAAVTRMAEGIDTSAYPPMDPGLVAPVVGWLAHESCSVTAEIFTAIAGRIARVAVAEARGVYRPAWSVEDIATHLDGIRDMTDPLYFAVVPDGHAEHIRHSFARALHEAAHD